METKNVEPLVGDEITRLRGGMTQETFAQKLNVDQPRINAWEKGRLVPPTKMLIKLGNIATNREAKKFFWEKAGLDTEQQEKYIREEFLGEVEKSEKTSDVVRVRLHKGATENLLQDVPLPATRVPHPKSAFCVEIGNDTSLLPGFLGRGDWAVIDASRRQLIPGSADLVALDFNVPVRWREHVDWHKRARDLDKSRWGVSRVGGMNNPAQLTNTTNGSELHASSGVRFGWLRLAASDEGLIALDDDFTSRWCYVLENARIKGVRESCRALQLTDWMDEDQLPKKKFELHGCLWKKGIHVLGTVIGWIASPRTKAEVGG